MAKDVDVTLPPGFYDHASRRGHEWAWPVSQIREVIEAVRKANAINLGGQLQLRLPGMDTIELPDIEVDALTLMPAGLAWPDQVEASATHALAQLCDLENRFDFEAEARAALIGKIDDGSVQEDLPREVMCFAWYFQLRPIGERALSGQNYLFATAQPCKCRV